ncbi:hypothetical protein ENBRE01_2479, partial [Enteropsectra breve]
LLDGMEFTPSNRIKKMKMPDSFNILMLEIITKLRKVYVQTIKGITLGNTQTLHEFLALYVDLDYKPDIRYFKQSTETVKKTNITVEKNTAFAVNMVCNLATFGRWEHYKELLTAYDNFGQSGAQEEAFFDENFYLSTTLCDHDREIIKLFDKIPVLKAAIILCSICKNDIVVRHPDFKIISKSNSMRVPFTIIKEKANDDEILLSDMEIFHDKPKTLHIMLPARNVVEYFKFIRNYLRLTDSIETIAIRFYDSKRLAKYDFSSDDYRNTNDFIGWVINYFIKEEIVASRPKISGIGIYGYDRIEEHTLATLAKIPLQSFALLGTDSTLDYFYLFKLFEFESQLKSSIQKFDGAFGAAVLLYQLIGRRQITSVSISTLMQFKKLNMDMIKEDACYNRLTAYFDNGDLHSLPKACKNDIITGNFGVLRLMLVLPINSLSYLGLYNTSAKSKAEIAKEIEVDKKDIQGVFVRCKPSDFNLINVEEKNTNETTITIKHFFVDNIIYVNTEMHFIENKDILIIEYLRPLSFKGFFTRSKEKKDLITILIDVFRKWIVNDTTKKHKLIFKVAETKKSTCPLRDIFIRTYEKIYENSHLTDCLERLTFIRI